MSEKGLFSRFLLWIPRNEEHTSSKNGSRLSDERVKTIAESVIFEEVNVKQKKRIPIL